MSAILSKPETGALNAFFKDEEPPQPHTDVPAVFHPEKIIEDLATLQLPDDFRRHSSLQRGSLKPNRGHHPSERQGAPPVQKHSFSPLHDFFQEGDAVSLDG